MPDSLQRIVIVGATSSIAEHCARLWAARNAPALTLVPPALTVTEVLPALNRSVTDVVLAWI